MAESDTSIEPGKRPERLHDRFFKDIFRRYEYVISLIRIGIPDILSDIIDWSTLSLQPTEIAIPGMTERFADLVFSVELKSNGEVIHLILLFEHKSYRDSNLLRQVERNQFLIHVQNDFKSPIIPIVVLQYDPRADSTDSRKTTPVEFIDLYKNLADEFRAILTEYSVNFKCMLIDVNEIDQLDLARDTNIETVIHLMSKVREARLSLVQELLDRKGTIPPEDHEWAYGLMIGYFSDYNEDISKGDILAQARNSEERQMLQSAAEFLRQEGREEVREEVAANLLRDGMDPEKVAEVTDLSRDAVQKLQR